MNITSKLTLTISLGVVSLTLFALGADHPAASLGAEPALAKLKEGNARFVESTVSSGKPTAAKRAETAQGQHPFAIVVACADSRTSPEIIFDQNIGDLFVIRNAGNLTDEHVFGSIEYAVEHLGARLIIVLGHSHCGAVTAAVAGETAPGHIQSLVRDIQPAVKAVKNGNEKGDVTELAIAENARLMANKIRTQAELGDLAKEVRIIPAVYDLSSGKVEWLKE
jgi:carbonic anhydrase